MAEKYTFDVDIDPVLQAGLNEELDVIIRLMKANDFLKNIEKDQLFMRNYPDHRRYVHLISMQIRSCGGHAVVNLLRGGKGPDYKTVVSDVAYHLNVKYDPDDSVPVIERRILMSMAQKLYEDLGESERKLLIDSLSAQEDKSCTGDQDSVASSSVVDRVGDTAGCQTMAASGVSSSATNTSLVVAPSRELIIKAVKQGDYKLLSNRSLLMLSETFSQVFSRVSGVAQTGLVTAADSVSRAAYELSLAINSGLDRLRRLISSLLEIGGPSYKVTVPCVTQIASMRLRQSGALLTKSDVALLANQTPANNDDTKDSSTQE